MIECMFTLNENDSALVCGRLKAGLNASSGSPVVENGIPFHSAFSSLFNYIVKVSTGAAIVLARSTAELLYVRKRGEIRCFSECQNNPL